MLQHRGGSTEEREVLRSDAEAGSAWLLSCAGDKAALLQKVGFLKAMDYFFKKRQACLSGTLPGTMFAPVLWRQDGGLLKTTTPGRLYSSQTMNNCTCRKVVSRSAWK